MPKIDFQIGSAIFELCRDRIWEILVDEISVQTALSGIGIYCQRSVPFSDTEIKAINVSLANVNYVNPHRGQSTAEATYFIDCFAKGKTTAIQRGDYASHKLCQQIAGIVRYILQDTRYMVLGFATPALDGVDVIAVRPLESTELQDKSYVSMCRVEVVVKSKEINSLIVPRLLEGYQTTINIGNTDSGYFSTT
jgi:hypothetical protein